MDVQPTHKNTAQLPNAKTERNMHMHVAHFGYCFLKSGNLLDSQLILLAVTESSPGCLINLMIGIVLVPTNKFISITG